MSVLRRDPTSYGWTIYPEEDYTLPRLNKCDDVAIAPEECPFCPTHEHLTPPEICAIRPPDSAPNSPGWKVRTIPDRSAVLRVEGKLERRGEGVYDMMSGIGAHELIIETPDHSARLSQMGPANVRDVLWMYRERVRDLRKDPRFRYIQVCRNYRPLAGARHPHPHSMVVALPVVPRGVREELNRASEYWGIKERCVFCDIVDQESGKKSGRLVFENSDFVVLEPFAARRPFESWILPKVHSANFHEIDDAQLPRLAEALAALLRGLESVLDDPPYNLILHTAPIRSSHGTDHLTKPDPADYFHWHIEIMPRVRELTGFEFGTGISVNPVLPEIAGEKLRSVLYTPKP